MPKAMTSTQIRNRAKRVQKKKLIPDHVDNEPDKRTPLPVPQITDKVKALGRIPKKKSDEKTSTTNFG